MPSMAQEYVNIPVSPYTLANSLLILVGNIPFDVTEGELREKFEQAGPIVSFRYLLFTYL